MWSWVTAQFRSNETHATCAIASRPDHETQPTHSETPVVHHETQPAHTSTGAFRRLCAQYAHLAPRACSTAAFVRWMQDLGEGGHWAASDIYDDYFTLCELTGAAPMPQRWFTKGLVAAGCRKWRGNFIIDGVRWQPVMVTIPDEPVALDVQLLPQPAYKQFPKRSLRLAGVMPAQQKEMQAVAA